MNGGTPWLGTVAPTNRMRTATQAATSRRTESAERSPRARSTGRGGSSCGPIATAIASSTGSVQSVGDPERGEPSDKGPRESDPLRSEDDPAEHDQVEGDEPAQPRRRPDPSGPSMLADQADPLEGAPDHERPRGTVPQAAEHHREHQVAVGHQPRPPRLPPSGMYRKSRRKRDSVMCQRRQKSRKPVARYGLWKFCGNTKPSSSASPIAMSV